MFHKILLFTLFAACQAAKNEPWWIQMFFPNVSFTGKYHPSNYKVEKSPLFPDHLQNPNDVWSPAYWMPYKQAYSQYWIDLIDNATKAEQEKAKEAQEQLAQAWSENQDGQNGGGGQYEMNGQYDQNGGGGQHDQDGQYEMNGQYDQSDHHGMNGQYNIENGHQEVNGPYDQNGQYDYQSSQYDSNAGQNIVEEANNLAPQVQSQIQTTNQDAKHIADQATQKAKNQMQVVAESAFRRKRNIEAQTEFIHKQAEKVLAKTEEAAEAKIQ